MTDTTLPEPLVPAEVDLTDFAFMPLEVQRLRNSELASDETPECCWAAVLLWCAAWHEVPAASIPDNDQWQAKQAGYVARGRVDPQWAKVRTGALRNFVPCSDGRLYHSTLAKKALESWESKLRHAYGKMLDRLRKLNKARADQQLSSVAAPAFENWISAGRLDPIPPEVGTPAAGIPVEKGLKGIEGTGRSKGQGDSINTKTPPPSPPSGAPPQKPLLAVPRGAAEPRATRKAPKGWKPSPELGAWCAREHPRVDAALEAAKMADHTFATSRVDWDGTYRNWIRKADEQLGKSNGTSETPRERSARERIAEMTGGTVSRKPPAAAHHAQGNLEIVDVEPRPPTRRLG